MGSAAPARNFTLTLEERVRAAAGPPAWAVRKRRIEDLETSLLVALAAAWPEIEARHPGSRWAAVDELTARAAAAPDLSRLNDLIDRHNRYYPCEGNLAMDPRTGAYLERGQPWAPLQPVTALALVERVLARVNGRR